MLLDMHLFDCRCSRLLRKKKRRLHTHMSSKRLAACLLYIHSCGAAVPCVDGMGVALPAQVDHDFDLCSS